MDMQKIFDRVTPVAVLTLIVSAFYLASRSFWGVDLHRMEIVIMSTASFAACAWLLSSVLPTSMELYHHKHFASAGVVAALGLFLLALEISLTKIGFSWLKGQTVADHIVFSDWVLTTISVGLSIFNIFAKWTFVTVMEKIALIKEEMKAKELREERRAVRNKNRIEREKAGIQPKKPVLKSVTV